MEFGPWDRQGAVADFEGLCENHFLYDPEAVEVGVLDELLDEEAVLLGSWVEGSGFGNLVVDAVEFGFFLEPDDDFFGLLVYITHHLDLGAALGDVALVNAELVDPNPLFEVALAKDVEETP